MITTFENLFNIIVGFVSDMFTGLSNVLVNTAGLNSLDTYILDLKIITIDLHTILVFSFIAVIVYAVYKFLKWTVKSIFRF